MQINIDKNLVEFTPENEDEKVKLEALWRTMVDCMRFNKKTGAGGAICSSAGRLRKVCH